MRRSVHAPFADRDEGRPSEMEAPSIWRYSVAMTEPRGLRSDAERNRTKIVNAACEAFTEGGLDVPMEHVARRAGVGIATLYRRFPSRPELIAAAFQAKMTSYADAVAQALAEPDPWAGFCAHVERVCAMQAEDHGFTDVLTMTFPTARAFEAARVRAYEGFVELVARAKHAGRLRADFVPEDLIMVLMANAGVVTATGDAAPGTWRRFVAYVLQAFAAECAQPLPDPPSPKEIFRAMVRLQSAEVR
jgi:AcrR family transcriptional regulator